jgi:hypothetical protein
MAYTPANLKMVDDHIAQGERHVDRQRELIASLKAHGHPTEMAERLLVDFQSTLDQHRSHRAMMLREIEPDPMLPKPAATSPPRAKPAPKTR